jgi:hypothetical protein
VIHYVWCTLQLAIALLLVAPGVVQAQAWFEYRPAGAGYRIEFPQNPVVASTEVQTDAGTVKMYTATLSLDKTAFIATHAVFPRGVVTNPAVQLNNARNNILAANGTRLLQEQNMTVGGVPAKRIEVEQTDNLIIVLVVVSGDWLYQAIVVAVKGNENSSDSERFLSSFALVPR